jgi:hypothetical protein
MAVIHEKHERHEIKNRVRQQEINLISEEISWSTVYKLYVVFVLFVDQMLFPG